MPTYGSTRRKTPSSSKVSRIRATIPLTTISKEKAASHGFCSTYGVFAVNKLRCSRVKALEGAQVHGVPEPQQEYQMQDGAREDGADNDKAQGDRQTDEAQEGGHQNKVHKDWPGGGAFEDDVREYQARKRRVRIEESDAGAALRVQQVWEGRRPVEKGKHQRLNRFGPSNRDLISEDDVSMDGTGERESALMPMEEGTDTAPTTETVLADTAEGYNQSGNGYDRKHNQFNRT